MNSFKISIKDWDNFWFGPLANYNISLFRLLFGLSILGMYLVRFVNFDFYFTDGGILPFDYALKILPEGYPSILPFFLKTDAGIRFQGILHLILILGFTLGLFGRSLTWLLAIVNLGLMQRNMTVVYGADLFANFWLFYLSFINHNQYFSLWNLICKKRKKIEKSDMVSSMGVRLLQAQLCLTYAYTGLEKFKGNQWWEGSAIWHVTGIDDIISRDFSFLQNVPTLVASLSMMTVVFEVYFIFAIWNKRLRYPWLLVGVLFHISTAVFMELWFFAFMMIAPYLLFLPDLSKVSWPQFTKVFRKKS